MQINLLKELDLICPCCRHSTKEGLVQFPLQWRKICEQQGDYVLEGLLTCTNTSCNTIFPVVAGIPIILKDVASWWEEESPGPTAPAVCSPALQKYFQSMSFQNTSAQAEQSLVGAYMDFHYPGPIDDSNPFGGREMNSRYWEQLKKWVEPKENTAFDVSLDLGCSTGRLTFELAQNSKLAVGMDLKFSLVANAARIQRDQAISYQRKKYGGRFVTVQSSYTPVDNVLFLVGDALDPPFRASAFDYVAALSVLDNVSIPLILIGQMDALLAEGGKLLIGCPYEWLPSITAPDEWLGNHEIEPAGMLKRTVAGSAFPTMGLTYEILQEELNIPWAIRHHDRHWGVFSSHLLLAEKQKSHPEEH